VARREVRPVSAGLCPKCGKHAYLMHLHGDKGGPLMCPLCAGEWNAKHTRRRKFGRVFAKAARIYLENGGRAKDAKEILDTASLSRLGFLPEVLDPLGYGNDAIGDVPDLTTELLADVLQLTHPDRHPPERHELCNRVTRELLALKPYVFPAPKPKPDKPVPAPKRNGSDDPLCESLKKLSRQQRYPCELCCETVPLYYCDPCKAEWTKRQEAERERARAKRREQYRRRMQFKRWRPRPKICAADCDKPVTSKRKDALYCSPACRQRVHRHRVTDQSKNTREVCEAVTGVEVAP
jgi:hypothetical protein